MQVISEGSVRVDLVGGTLDIPPVNLILKDVKTLNVATSLKARAELTKTTDNGIEITSKDYDSVVFFKEEDFSEEKLYRSSHFGPLNFIAQILYYFNITKNLRLVLSSKAPAGSGLGGSSAMGVTLYKALCEYSGVDFDRIEAVKIVNSIEGRILNKGMPGYQDYYPALFSGILSLNSRVGEIEVEQLYSTELAEYLQKHITLVYSGDTRLSGINNWEVYKAFFDGDENVRQGMANIAQISNDFYNALKSQNYSQVIKLIAAEGLEREKLFPNICPQNIQDLKRNLNSSLEEIGLKMCGAGGGGCFIITHRHEDRAKVHECIASAQMYPLEFLIEAPL
jgi:D-glycero-alpha-D-manno-heptose-7-phosphate kinase